MGTLKRGLAHAFRDDDVIEWSMKLYHYQISSGLGRRDRHAPSRRLQGRRLFPTIKIFKRFGAKRQKATKRRGRPRAEPPASGQKVFPHHKNSSSGLERSDRKEETTSGSGGKRLRRASRGG